MANQFQDSPPPTFLFGAGGAASWVLQGFQREGLAVTGFIDDAAERIQNVGTVPVFTSDDPRISKATRETATVVCVVMNPAVDETKIQRRLLELGWRTVQTLGAFGRAELVRSGKRCGMLNAASLERHGDELGRARALLEDTHSRAVFDGFVGFCKQMDDTGFPEISRSPYFPPDLPRWSQRLRMIDCGAFDGDSVRSAKAHGYTIEACVCFEPDPRNYERLTANMKSDRSIMCLPCGVSGQTQMLKFAAQGDTGSAVIATGSVHVQCVALDDSMTHFAPNLLKFDIEGSEESALRGAEVLIRTFRPGLAVSVYHLPTDIWRIPLMLSEMLEGKARFFLRRHSRTIADTVLYVFPT